jgi:uncharacterized protein
MQQIILKSSLKIIVFNLFIWLAAISLHAQPVSDLKLKDYRPASIYKVPATTIPKAKYPVIDFHSHDYATTPAELDAWVKTMDEAGIAKTIILSGAVGNSFDSVVTEYARYKDRFEIWCGFDFRDCEAPGWQERAVNELVRCFKKGARGIGELGDKGLGEFYSYPGNKTGFAYHIDDPKMKPLIKKCGELNIPISIHVAEDAWMYEPADEKNDGLMNSFTWKVDMSKPGILNHDQLVQTLENAVRDNPATRFIACHLANTCADLSRLGKIFDACPNFYADVAARYGEIAPIPKYVRAFFEKYADRIVYGTDMGMEKSMYQTTFRILESNDEHFYEHERFGYHWPLYGLGLSTGTLEKIYSGNSKKILAK